MTKTNILVKISFNHHRRLNENLPKMLVVSYCYHKETEICLDQLTFSAIYSSKPTITLATIGGA